MRHSKPLCTEVYDSPRYGSYAPVITYSLVASVMWNACQDRCCMMSVPSGGRCTECVLLFPAAGQEHTLPRLERQEWSGVAHMSGMLFVRHSSRQAIGASSCLRTLGEIDLWQRALCPCVPATGKTKT